MIDQSEVVRYLLDRRLLSPHTVVDGTVVVRDASSRNRIFVVDSSDTSSFVLKQGTSPQGVAAVAHEAAVYQLLGQRGDRITHYLPTVWEYDTIGQVLILGKARGDRDLRDHQVRTGRFSRALATAIGDALGALHRETGESVPATPERRTPWVLSVHQPNLSIFRDASSAALELLRIVQSAPELGDSLDALRRGWEPSCLIHHDVKWDNLIACPPDNRPRARLRLKIIDWEAAQLGDPRWDLGSIFSHYLSLWMFSIPIAGRDPPERFPELARFPLSRMQPAMADCWSAYRKRADLDRPGGAQWLSAAVCYAGARLVQTAFEAAQVANSFGQQHGAPFAAGVEHPRPSPGSGRTPPWHFCGTGTMTAALDMQIQDALDAVNIRSATSFSWFGDLSPNLSAAARRAMTGSAMRDYLRYQLQMRLYGDFYCKGSATPGGEQRNTFRRTPTTPFIEALSAANTGTGAREGGWSVVNVAGDVVTVARDGLRVWVRREDIYADAEDTPSPAQLHAVRFPKELLKLSPGFYLALGNEGLAFEPGRVLVRFYWNLRAGDAPTLVKGATQLLNDDEIPFRLKVVNDPAHYDRCDAGVLYVQRADYEQVLLIVRQILVELGGNLKKATPVFTKVLAPGLGLAEELSVSRDSFGMDRCRLLAEAIVRIKEHAVGGATDRLAVIEEVFAEEGISLATPYLNPGSPDGYRF